MKKSLPLLFMFLFLLFPWQLRSQCWELIWAEEFDYTGFPDSSIWSFEVGGDGWGNNELQYYKANDQDNSWVKDGKLTIRAINESFGGRNYTSARIVTRDKFSVQYGKIEARIKLPFGQGIWPAFWGLGQNHAKAGWPACGEIDIMEMIGGTNRDNQVHGTLHWDNNGSHASYGGSYRLPSGIFADDFYRFSIVWTPQYIRWYVNDIQFHVTDIRPAGLSEFHQDFFLILNLAVGGNWPGAPNASTIFPQVLDVDYIRVYKNSSSIVNEVPVKGIAEMPGKAENIEFSLPAIPHWSYQWVVPADARIVSGQGTEKVTVTWGCSPGQIKCLVTGECATWEFKKNVEVKTTITGPMFIAENQKGVRLQTPAMAQTTFNWIIPNDAAIVQGNQTNSISVDWGTSFEDVILQTENECGLTQATFKVVKAGQYPFPDIYTPHPIPGMIESVNFDYGGRNVSWFDSTNGNQGNGPRADTDVDTQYSDNGQPNVGWITNGEWLEYSVKVKTEGYYRVDMRLATANATGGPFSLRFNSNNKITGIIINNTGGWASFVTRTVGTIYLTPEDTLMRLHFNTGGFNLGRITLTHDPVYGVESTGATKAVIFPNPAKSSIVIQHDVPLAAITITDITGKIMVRETGLSATSYPIATDLWWQGIYLLKLETLQGATEFHRFVKMD